MAAPTLLFTPKDEIYEVLSASPGSGFSVIFKYKISDRDTIPAWFYTSGNTEGYPANDPGGSSNWNWFGDTTKIKINTDHVSAGWAQWKDDDGNVDIFNRSAVLGCMQVAMKDSITISSDYRIQEFYTYNTYRVIPSTDITVTLPDPGPAVQRHVNIKVDRSPGVATLSAARGTIDGQSSITLAQSPNIQTFYNDGTNWFSTKSVGFDNSDDTPVTAIRSLTQSQYNTLTAGVGANSNTLYLIRDE